MTITEFIEKYDYPNSVVLLEGKRSVADNDINKLIRLGELLASSTGYMKFRSGNAQGADLLFSTGVTRVSPHRLEIITPYSGHRKNQMVACDIMPLDAIDLVCESKVIYQSKLNKKTEKLIDGFVSGARDRITVKAAYIIRDTIKVIGTSCGIRPASFGIFYDDLEKPRTGGTGHTMNICELNKVECIDQSVWFGWLDEAGETG